MFEVGDLIRLDNEVCRVVSLTSTVFTVERAVYGTAKADHTNNTDIRFPFFNAFTGKYRYIMTIAGLSSHDLFQGSDSVRIS